MNTEYIFDLLVTKTMDISDGVRIKKVKMDKIEFAPSGEYVKFRLQGISNYRGKSFLLRHFTIYKKFAPSYPFERIIEIGKFANIYEAKFFAQYSMMFPMELNNCPTK